MDFKPSQEQSLRQENESQNLSPMIFKLEDKAIDISKETKIQWGELALRLYIEAYNEFFSDRNNSYFAK